MRTSIYPAPVRFAATLFGAIALLGTTTANADDDFWVGAKAGTLGWGLEATWRPIPYLDLRAGLNTFSFDTERNEAGINYDAEVDLQSLYVTANVRVPASPFRLTAGVFSNGTEITLTSAELNTVVIGGQSFDATQVGQLKGRGDFDNIAPYAGVGLDFRLGDTVGLNIDAGVLFQGSMKITLKATGPIADNAIFQQALETERQELESEVDDYEIYPVLSMGFSVNF